LTFKKLILSTFPGEKMPFYLNKVQLIGHLGRNAEFRLTTSQREITSFTVATIYSYKNKDGEWVRETTWHRVLYYFTLSDYYREYLKKGAKVYIEGRLHSREYTDNDKIRKVAWEILADQIIPLTHGGNRNEENSISDDVNNDMYADSLPDGPPSDEKLPF
jgi:single-strand DNA-binding protein